MQLEDLVPELLARILQVLDHPRDLLSLIRASPHCFRVYAESPAIILSPILKNAILPDALHHALACVHLPSISSQTVPVAFLRDYFQYEPLAFPTDKTALTALCGLCLRTSHFVDDYSSRAMRALNLKSDAGQATASALSSTERARFQRAFFRYELYCRIFPVDHYARSRSLVPADEQFTEFIARMAPWEVEEVSCVHHYFTVLIGRFLDDLEDQFVEAVRTAPGFRHPILTDFLTDSLTPEPAKRRKIRRTTASGLKHDSFIPSSEPTQKDMDDRQSPADNANVVFVSNFDLYGLDLFSSDGRFRSPKYVSYVASLGSTLMYRLALGDKGQRRRIIQENTPVWRDFLPEALEHAPGTGPKTTMPYGIDDNHLSHPNLGYYRFKRSEEEIYFGILNASILSRPLRERAFVFWDADRILCPVVSDQLQKARRMDPERVHLQFDRYEGKSAEERLKGVRIPRVQMDRIVEEFGSLFESWRSIHHQCISRNENSMP
ncbi:hypothetical protein TGAMA5MH_07410 [Trichoderma gamsii]|uniref:Uncharacterized protein n=1 Tax=Trichoderma gamsii TaxID=398673 RepID=A0A2K0T594_9HYPO|nr:hypothetical protein TGAMA5MH_07410 [Trichoderma gamsii]